MTAPDKVHCSFCGKSQDDVTRIVAGPDAFICNGCVDDCAAICAAEGIPSAIPQQKRTVPRTLAERELALTCLKLSLDARPRTANCRSVIGVADRFYEFVTMSDAEPEPGSASDAPTGAATSAMLSSTVAAMAAAKANEAFKGGSSTAIDDVCELQGQLERKHNPARGGSDA